MLETKDFSDPAHRQSLGRRWASSLNDEAVLSRLRCRPKRARGAAKSCSRSREIVAHDRLKSILMMR